ncbi:MAG: hypothetical protein M1546_09540, partial [Chloroflexi bacterium]|nr:hypothetical protein [Chloroflexota bacterium]
MTEVLHIPDDIPDDFPHFLVPGHEDDMAALRMLFWKHFLPDGPAWDDWLNGPDLFPRYPILPSGPKTTLWDEWLCASMLWPAVESNGIRERMQARWRESLGTRAMDSAGYVTTNNGASYAHLLGWPFPAWSHGSGGYGWHFSFKGQLGELGTPNGMAYRPPRLCNQDGWQLNGASDQGIDGSGWHLTLTGSDATA